MFGSIQVAFSKNIDFSLLFNIYKSGASHFIIAEAKVLLYSS
jgi:hypothetical protein